MTPGWSSPGAARVADVVRRRAGLTFTDARRSEVEHTIHRTMRSRGIESEQRFIELLDEDAAMREALVAELTVGETYFMRVQEHFELLRWELLPALLSRGDDPVRVWSAGCASGEEPYSVAMVFDELGALHRADITGTDIARPRLEQARAGVYSRWSLRGVSDAMIRRYFRARDARHVELSPRIRRRVTFRYLNLAEDPFPSLSTGIWGMDVILCRNVLIYFDEPAVERVARRLIASLSDDGWLLPGPSDPAIAPFVDCDVVMTDAGLAYRRPGRAESPDARGRVTRPEVPPGPPRIEPVHIAEERVAPAVPDGVETAGAERDRAEADRVEPQRAEAESAAEATEREGLSQLERAWRERDFDSVAAVAREMAGSDAADERLYVRWLRALANRGRLEEAAEVAVRALDGCGPTAELLYLNAVILLHGGHASAAAVSARQALYVDRSLTVAHITLADAQQRLGDTRAARRSLETAADQLARRPAHEPVRAADGELAGRLAEMIRVRLRLLGEAA